MSQLFEALSKVIDPELRKPITELGMVEKAELSGGKVDIKVLLTIAGCPMRDRLTEDIHKALSEIAGVKEIALEFGVMTEAQREKVRDIVRGGKAKEIPFARPDSLTRVIGISSGKGGVGKSSLTANLAIAVARLGFNVGILDADVYGHSIPRLLGLIGQRPTAIDDMFIPLENYGVKCVSMEMFKPERSDPVAYRGPILHKVLQQLLTDAFWGDLDFLFLDLPPGTGDLAISLGQLIPASELIVVTTPQIAAAEVAERSGRIAHQLKQQIIGVIENMSAFPCPTCGEAIELFGSGGGEATAARLGHLVGAEVPVLGKIPFSNALRSGGDDGSPIVVTHQNDAASEVIAKIAEELTLRKRSLVGVNLKLNT
ncbi:MAG: Mrp/NBP35 family ATP-binding protein [Candidatus Nanopelagicaceae bacterium]